MYLTFGARAVIVVDPADGTFVVYDAPASATTYVRPVVPAFAAYPDLRVDLDELFRNLS